jgi:very-short-patch-repair endonuclease
MHNHPTMNAQTNARTLRREMTDSERRLWTRLRGEQLGVKFRRQHPLGNYAVLRFATDQPFLNLDGVLTVIADELAARRVPPSQPSPEGGRSEPRSLP